MLNLKDRIDLVKSTRRTLKQHRLQIEQKRAPHNVIVQEGSMTHLVGCLIPIINNELYPQCRQQLQQ